MYLQNKNCEFLSIFLLKEGSKKYIKLLCKTKLWDKLEKEEFVEKCSVKKLFLKISQNSQKKVSSTNLSKMNLFNINITLYNF